MSNRSRPQRIGTLLLAVLLSAPGLVALGSLGACQEQLFKESDTSVEDSLKRYYDGDSASDNTEKRRQRNTSAFGYPAGLGGQD